MYTKFVDVSCRPHESIIVNSFCKKLLGFVVLEIFVTNILTIIFECEL